MAKGAERILLIPYFLYMGAHVQEDLPAELTEARKRHPAVEMAMGKHLGAHKKLAEIVVERIAEGLTVTGVALMSVHLGPQEIEAESFRIIDREVGPHQWSPAEWPVVRRVIHTSADFDYAHTLFFSSAAVARGIDRPCGGARHRYRYHHGPGRDQQGTAGALPVPTSCFVADPELARQAKAQGITRSILAMRKGAADQENGIFVIGNAPTALF